jgi:glycosidase
MDRLVYVDQLGLADHSRLSPYLLGPAWDYDESTDEYYLHLYLTKQPDLNWDNVEVRESVYGMMRFWLDRGCDGFRVRSIQLSRAPFSSFVIDWVKMDVINLLSKADGLPDAPVVDEGDPTQLASMHYANGPRVHEYIKEMNKKVLSRALSSGSPPASGTHRVTTDYDIFTVGEAPFSHSADDLAEYVLPQNRELQTIFHFELMDIDSSGPLERFIPKPWKLSGLKDIVEKWQTFKRGEGFWNTSVPIHPYIQTKKGHRKLIAPSRPVSISKTTTNRESYPALETILKNGGHGPPNSLRYSRSPKGELCLSIRAKSSG